MTGIVRELDLLWVLVATAMVMLMQVGFLCLESGLVRAKNSINVATKNLVDFCLSGLIFAVLGFGLMFGNSFGGWIGGSHFFFADHANAHLTAFVLFQLVFCGTAATIISGVMAERVRFSGYLLVTAIVSALIYPVFGHWAWGGALADSGRGWLGAMGFIDFAGSTVVHSVGAWTALAVVIVVGPRIGQFDGTGQRIHGHNLVLAALGTLVLWFAWFGFNGGSTLVLDNRVPGILLNTNMAACAGGMTALVLSRLLGRRWDLPMIMNGCIAGLVSITAGCHLVGPALAIGIGAAAGGACYGGIHLLRSLKVDDAIGGVSAHGFAGALGTLAVALADPQMFGTGLTRWQQLGVQAIGVLTAFIWAFFIALILLGLINRWRPLRVPPDEEYRGLNITEHNASSELLDLLNAMDSQQRTGNFSEQVKVEPHTEVGQIAQQFNRVLTRVHAEISEHRLTTQHMLIAKEEAEAASMVKNEFLANMSHEIRTPMNGVLGMLGVLLQSRPELTEEQRVLATVASDSAEDLLSIINDILDFSKIEAGQMELEAIPFSLAEIIENVLQLLGRKAHDKGLELLTWIYHDVPATVVGDPTRLRQILLNLVSNAIKFTERGEITVRVSKAHETAAHVYLHFSIDDTGIGIEPDVMSRLFSPFQQADGSTTRRFGGTGLGLAICKQLVELMGGRIGVESRLGKGSSFWLSVQLQRHADDVDTPEVAAPPQRPRVLVVDDSLAVQNTMRHMLEEWQIHPGMASSAYQAMELLRVQHQLGEPYDLVIIDYRMPEINGLQLCQWMQTDPDMAGIRRVLFSAYSSEITQADRDACGIERVIDKPVRQQQLWQTIFPGFRLREQRHDDEDNAAKEARLLMARQRSLRILLAEDTLTNRQVALYQFRQLGHPSLVAVENGQLVLDVLLRDPNFDVVFMDCQMPVMDGFAATRSIRDGLAGDAVRNIPIIALTANALSGDRSACLAAGMNDYISKPVSLEKLADALIRHFERCQQHPTPPIPSAPEDPLNGDDLESLFPPELIDLFFSETSTMLAHLQTATDMDDLATIQKIAHALKGMAGNFSFAGPVCQLATQIDLAAKSGNLPSIKSILATLQQTFADLQR